MPHTTRMQQRLDISDLSKSGQHTLSPWPSCQWIRNWQTMNLFGFMTYSSCLRVRHTPSSRPAIRAFPCKVTMGKSNRGQGRHDAAAAKLGQGLRLPPSSSAAAQLCADTSSRSPPASHGACQQGY